MLILTLILEYGIPAALLYWWFGPLGPLLGLGVPLIVYVVLCLKANR